MTDMVERVARAISPAAFANGYSSKTVQGAEQARARILARAAIEAMREPSDWMVQKAWLSMPDAIRSQWHGRDIVKDAYQAAIDAVLANTP